MYTIVVADDEQEIRRSLIKNVDWEAAGFQVIGEAENGIEALELVEKLEPDLLLTDIKMPFVTGIELAREVREIRPTMQIAFLSGYDDFMYAQQAIQYNIISYILKPVSARGMTEELKKIYQKMNEKFREFAANDKIQEKMEKSEFLIPLLLDGSTGEEEMLLERKTLLEQAVSCGLIDAQDPSLLKYVVIVTKFYNNENKNCTTRSSVHAVELILKKYIKYASFYAEGKVVSLLMGTERTFENYLHILADDISQSVERIMNYRCTIGISRIVSELSGVHECYQEAMNALRYVAETDRTVHYISDEEMEERLDHDMIQEILSEIESLVRSGTKEELEEYLDRFLMKTQNELSGSTLDFLLLQIFSTVYKTVFTVAGSEALAKLQESMPLYGLQGRGHSVQQYMEICRNAREIIAEQRRRSGEVLCEHAIRMIEEQFMDSELSLVSVSNAIAVSPNYLSAVLKKETGKTFKDLLTHARIEEAKRLLMYSNLKVRETAEKCGYSDQHYFSYCFKKYTGESPNGFRRAYEDKEK